MSSTNESKTENVTKPETENNMGRVCSMLMRDGSVFEVTDEVAFKEIGVFKRALLNSDKRVVELDMSEYFPSFIMRVLDNVKALSEGGVDAAINICKTFDSYELSWFKYQAHKMDCPVILDAIDSFEEYRYTLASNKRIEKWLEDSRRALGQ